MLIAYLKTNKVLSCLFAWNVCARRAIQIACGSWDVICSPAIKLNVLKALIVIQTQHIERNINYSFCRCELHWKWFYSRWTSDWRCQPFYFLLLEVLSEYKSPYLIWLLHTLGYKELCTMNLASWEYLTYTSFYKRISHGSNWGWRISIWLLRTK
jgi:hypothetical protein